MNCNAKRTLVTMSGGVATAATSALLNIDGWLIFGLLGYSITCITYDIISIRKRYFRITGDIPPYYPIKQHDMCLMRKNIRVVVRANARALGMVFSLIIALVVGARVLAFVSSHGQEQFQPLPILPIALCAAYPTCLYVWAKMIGAERR